MYTTQYDFLQELTPILSAIHRSRADKSLKTKFSMNVGNAHTSVTIGDDYIEHKLGLSPEQIKVSSYWKRWHPASDDYRCLEIKFDDKSYLNDDFSCYDDRVPLKLCSRLMSFAANLYLGFRPYLGQDDALEQYKQRSEVLIKSAAFLGKHISFVNDDEPAADISTAEQKLSDTFKAVREYQIIDSLVGMPLYDTWSLGHKWNDDGTPHIRGALHYMSENQDISAVQWKADLQVRMKKAGMRVVK